MTFGSLFTGIGGFDLGFHRAGMRCLWQVEKEPSCRTILERHFPEAERYTNVCDFNATLPVQRPYVICGGFPCQDLSVAGSRAGLAGKRSGLWTEFRRLIGEFSPMWVVIENVPGLLSSNSGRDFGSVIESLGQLGYGTAYRILDAQYFGVPQRRRRVFIVGCLGNWRRAAEILFEPDCLPWHPAPSRKAGARVAATISAGTSASSGVNRPGRRREDDTNLAFGIGGGDVSHALNGDGGKFGSGRQGQDTFVAATLNSGGNAGGFRTEPGEHLVFDTTQITSPGNYSQPKPGDACHPLASGAHAPAVAFQTRIARNGRGQPKDIADALTSADGGTHADSKPHVAGAFGVRRLTPTECERLQGFPDNWTRWGHDGKELADSPRYRMLGNAVAVPVAEWIGRRLMEANK